MTCSRMAWRLETAKDCNTLSYRRDWKLSVSMMANPLPVALPALRRAHKSAWSGYASLTGGSARRRSGPNSSNQAGGKSSMALVSLTITVWLSSMFVYSAGLKFIHYDRAGSLVRA